MLSLQSGSYEISMFHCSKLKEQEPFSSEPPGWSTFLLGWYALSVFNCEFEDHI